MTLWASDADGEAGRVGEETHVDDETTRTMVVGHDGSTGADDCLEFALGIAEKLGVAVLVVRAWTVDTAPHGTLFDHGYVSSFAEASAKVRDLLVGDVAAAVAGHPEVRVRYEGVLGQPAAVLIKASTDAVMLLVGSHGRGGFARMMLGSVSEQCVRHADCPVLVTRPVHR